MERERRMKVIAVAVLVVAVVGLSLGFAAFSNVLTISPTAEVQPINSMKVLFSSSNSSQEEIGTNIQIQYLPGGETTLYPNFTASIPVISNAVVSAPTLSNLKATFIRPGESVTYTLYIHNDSTYDVSLSAIEFGNKTCSAKSGTSQTLVDAACDEIDISVTVGGGTNEPIAVTKTQKNSSSPTVTGHVLGTGEYETVKVTLSYDDLSGGSGNTDLNGDFDVTFGDVTLTYVSTASGS